MTTRVDEAALIADLCRPGGPVVRDLERKAIRTRDIAARKAPVDTGRLRSSITWRIEFVAGRPVAVIGTNVEYARFVHDGTGIHGRAKAPILAKPGKVFVFTPKGSTDAVFARSNKGVTARPFLTDALKEALT